MHRSKQHHYSITSSARASSDVGMSRPSVFAVLTLMIFVLAPLQAAGFFLFHAFASGN